MADLTITITIPDAVREEFLTAYATRFGWVDQATSGTKAAFARDKARNLVRGPLRAYRREQAELAIVVPEDGITAA